MKVLILDNNINRCEDYFEKVNPYRSKGIHLDILYNLPNPEVYKNLDYEYVFIHYNNEERPFLQDYSKASYKRIFFSKEYGWEVNKKRSDDTWTIHQENIFSFIDSEILK